jgi:head-tail adaptor
MLGIVNIGEKRSRLRIESYSFTNNAITNEPVKTWSELKTVWAKQLGPLSRETFEGNQEVAIDEVRFLVSVEGVIKAITTDMTTITVDSTLITVDSLNGFVNVINEKMRCVCNGITYYVNSIEIMRDKGFAILKAEKRDNG